MIQTLFGSLEQPEKKQSIFGRVKERMQEGLTRTRENLTERIDDVLSIGKEIDAGTLDDLEGILLASDLGAPTTNEVLTAMREKANRKQIGDTAELKRVLKGELLAILNRAAQSQPAQVADAPEVILVVGVNGVGKTTTIGKLAHAFRAQGKTVLMAAGDTFRAAAIEQLEIWGQRTAVPVVKGKEGGDPSAVIFDAVKRAQGEGFDVVICDTAGRLHTKENLMAELEKVRRVMRKALPDAPHEVLLVLDSTNGQNAIAQAASFKQAMDITGIVLTKLDGTAKGGVILGICDELEVPVRFIGIGEKVEDLRPFDAHEFVQALYE